MTTTENPRPDYYDGLSDAAKARFDAAPAWQQASTFLTAASWESDPAGVMKRQDRWTAAHSDPRKRR